MPRSAGRIDDVKSENSLRAPFSFSSIEHRIERTVEQRLHQAVRRVIAAGDFARVPPRFGTTGEGECAAMILAHWHKFEQPFVNGAQFFGRHVAPVNADAAIVIHQPAQFEGRCHEGAIGKFHFIQVRRETAGKDSSQRRQAQ